VSNCGYCTSETAQTSQRESGQIRKKGWRFQKERSGVSCNLPGAQLPEAQHEDHKHCMWQGHAGRVGSPT